MPRIKTLSRTENRAVVANLLDLGFTVPAITFMTGKTDVAIYGLLERLGRKRGRTLVRREPVVLDPQALRLTSRLFAEPDFVVPHLLGVARALRRADNDAD